MRDCELAGQEIFSENAPFIYARVFNTPAAVRACRRIPALLWEPKQSGNRSRCNTLDLASKVVWQAFPLHPLWAALTRRKAPATRSLEQRATLTASNAKWIPFGKVRDFIPKTLFSTGQKKRRLRVLRSRLTWDYFLSCASFHSANARCPSSLS